MNDKSEVNRVSVSYAVEVEKDDYVTLRYFLAEISRFRLSCLITSSNTIF